MHENLPSRGRVALAAIALGLAVAVELFVRIRGTDRTQPQTGGWEFIDFEPVHGSPEPSGPTVEISAEEPIIPVTPRQVFL